MPANQGSIQVLEKNRYAVLLQEIVDSHSARIYEDDQSVFPLIWPLLPIRF